MGSPLDRVARVLEARLPGVTASVERSRWMGAHVVLRDARGGHDLGWYSPGRVGTVWLHRWGWRPLRSAPWTEGTGLRRLVAVAEGGRDGE